jgi:hypothetical protein
MKTLVWIFCRIFGHNKILESKKEGRFTLHYTRCSQCEKKWVSKKLGIIPKMHFIEYTIKTRAHGQKMIIENVQEKIINKKPIVNFYAL